MILMLTDWYLIYFVIRADLESRAEQEDYYQYYSSRHSHYAAGGGGGGGFRERKRRIAPPPPPGFDDSPPVRKRIAPPPPDSFSSGSDGDGGPPVFRNIKVTIKNDSDGTPSLSESEDDRRTSRKKKRRSEKEKRRRLERKLAKREEELKLLSEQQRLATTRGVKTNQPKKSIKERLGVRKEDVPSVTTRRSLPQSSSESSRRDELLRRAEIRRQNQEKSPIPYQGKKGATTSPRSGRKQSPSRSRDRGGGGGGGAGKPLDGRRRKRRRRRRERGRGLKQMGLKEENAEMTAKLLDRGIRGSRGRSGPRVEARLARLAGSETPYDSESGSDSDTESEDHSRLSQQSKLTGKMRSDEVKVEARAGAGAGKTGDGDKWKHDKFSEAAGDEEDQSENKFSQHWSRNRRDRSIKTGGRARSTSSRSGSRRRSRSRRTKSRSSRSKSRRKAKKTRRRGKFSRSRSRSSSSSSSSRSRSVSRRRSSSSSRSRSRRRSRSGSSDSAGRSEDRIKKEGVNLGLSGSLAADTNTLNGSVVKYSEPTEAKKPKKKWRLYVFKVCLRRLTVMLW